MEFNGSSIKGFHNFVVDVDAFILQSQLRLISVFEKEVMVLQNHQCW